ncbi:hypothetical protein [Velocimicrobium porci]|uniref:Uncharacterized protein n=1 Tax=Velocimicrobium porci TaxID=2606634 RepID=A0A6L5Y0C7_9FIRM|nr:hypothetical protein [Velocimicrobium porci]MSS64586.1 hypothetical protein [Velocimicrobium porci]
MDTKILIRELHKYWELEKQAEGTTLEELVKVYRQDILHYGENPVGLRMLSSRDYNYYLNLLEEKSLEEYEKGKEE